MTGREGDAVAETPIIEFRGVRKAFGANVVLAAVDLSVRPGEVLVILSLCRELGPTLTALMVAARVGAGITAELGTMAVTEQVDALRALGASPIRKLVLPRVVAVIIMMPMKYAKKNDLPTPETTSSTTIVCMREFR